MAFSPSTKHKTTASTFSSIVDATSGEFTESLTVSGVPVSTDPGDFSFFGVLLNKNSNQSTSNATDTPVTWDTSVYDIGGWFASPGDTFVTVPVGVNRVNIIANIHWATNQSNLRQLEIFIDTGSGFTDAVDGRIFDREDADGGGADVVHVKSYPLDVNAGDKIQVIAFQSSGGNLNIQNDQINWFAVEAVEGGVGFTGPAGATGAGALEFQKFDNTYSPLGLWNFEENMLDSSGNSFDLTTGAGTERYTRIGGLLAFKFDNSTYLRHNVTDTLLDVKAGDVTIEALLVTNDFQTDDNIVAYGTSGESSATNAQYSFRCNSTGRFDYLVEKGSGTNVTYTIDDGAIEGVLHHLVMVRESQQVTFYIDGVQIGDTSGVLDEPTGGSSAVLQVGGSGGSNNLDGGMLSLKVIGRALTPAEVQAEYNLTLGNRGRALGAAGADGAQGIQGFTGVDGPTGPTGPAGPTEFFQKFDTTHSPVVLYNFEDDLTDSSGNGLDLTLSAGVSRFTSIEGLRAFSFNGAEGLTHPAGTALEIVGDLTIEVLLVSNRTQFENILEYALGGDASSASNHLYQFSMDTGRELRFGWEIASQAFETYGDPDAGVPLSVLTYAAVTRSSDQITFYVDGKQAGATSVVRTSTFGGSNAFLNIGRGANNNLHFLGAIASVKIINSALSGAEILAEYDRTLGGRVRP